LIQAEYASLLEAGKKTEENVDTTRFESLILMHDKVKSIRAFPPVGEQSVSTAIPVIILAMLPSFLDFFLNGLGF